MEEVEGCKPVWSEAQAATPKIQEICVQMKPCAEKAASQMFPVFTAVCYKDQVQHNRHNYIILVYVGGMNYKDLNVFKDNKGKLMFKEIKPEHDPIHICS